MRLPYVLAGSFAFVVLCGSSAGAQQDVVWTHMVNATASGNTLQKSAGCDGCEDSGGISQQQISSGTGGVQFIPGVGPGQQVYAGLTHTITTPLTYTQLEYAFAVYGTATSYACEVRERGAWKADCAFVAGDVLRISIEAGPVVRYYRNGAAVYTSAAVPADYPFVLGADLFNVGAAIASAAIMMPSLTNWTSSDIGSVGLAGDASYSGDILTVKGAGAGIGGAIDAFHFVYQTLSGDGVLVTRVDGIPGPNPLATAGLMMRDGLNPDAAHVMVGLTPTGGLEFRQRPAPGGATASLPAGTRVLPVWIKLVRFGHTIAAYSSSDGTTWAAVGSTAEAMGVTLDVGIVVTSHDPTQLNASTFESLLLEAKGVATTYLAITDRAVYPKPVLPSLGPAGSRFVDPAFGSRLLRVTDTNTRPGYPGRSLTAPSAAHQLAWNASSDHFYIRSIDGTIIPYAFDARTMTASRIAPSSMENGGLTILSQVEPQFSFLSSNLLFGSRQDPVNDWPIIRQFDFNTQTYADLWNLGTVTAIAPGTYAGALSSSATTPEKLSVLFGGVQDTNYKVAVLQIGPAGVGPVVLDTQASTITMNGVTTSTNIPLGVFLHHAWMDQSGRYVLLFTVNQQPVPYYVWDLDTNVITDVTANAGGHDATGFRWQINQACCTATAWDAAQWQSRALGTPGTTADLINPVLTPQEIFLADHTSWNNAQAGTLMPILSSLYRYYTGGANTTPWRAWDDEIVAIETGAVHGATVWRFAHHRSDVSYDGDPSRLYFWYQPIAVISPNGRWAIFTSNWEKSLGAAVDSDRQPGGMFRTDVFMVELAQAASAGPPAPPTDTTPPTTSATATPGPNGSGWNTTGVAVILAAIDNDGGSGVGQISYTLSGAQSGAGTAAGSRTSLAVSADGDTTLTYFATDNAGNQEAARTLTIRIDTTSPTTTATPTPGANDPGWNRTRVTVVLSALDNGGGSGVNHISYALSGAQSGAGSVAGRRTRVVISAEGDTTLTYFATDNADNQETARTLTIRIDRTPPATSATATPGPNGSRWNAADVAVVLSAVDNEGGSGVSQISYTLKGAQAGTGSVAGSTGSLTISAEGDTAVTYFATDNTGNRERAQRLIVRIDRTPPVTSTRASPVPNGSGWNKRNVTVVLSTADNRGGSGVNQINYALSGAQSGEGSVAGRRTQLVISAEGETILTYFATDNVGTPEAARTLTIRIDRTPPAITCGVSPSLLRPPNHQLVAVVATVPVTDRLSGAAGFTLNRVTSSQPDKGTETDDVAGDIQEFVVGTPDVSGQLRAEQSPANRVRTYAVKYVGVDMAGNQASCTSTVSVPRN